MAGAPVNAENEDDFDFDLDFDLDNLDDMDDEELQKLLEQDPELEAELRAIEEAELTERNSSQSVTETALPPAFSSEDTAFIEASGEDLDDQFGEQFSDAMDNNVGQIPPPELPPAVAPPPPVDINPLEEGQVSDASFDETFTPFRVTLPPIPRINIHAFCLTEGVSSLIEKSSMDRRLSKAHLTIYTGGVERAAEVYEFESSPNLVIIETGADASEMIDGLDRLATVCDPSTRVICIGQLNDIRLYRDLMDRGVSEYLVRPRSPLQLISAIGDLYTDPDAPAVGRSYVFVGARGGVGSSTVSHNVAWGLAEEYQSDTVLVDLDLAFGTASLDFEHDPSQGLSEALSAPERLDDVLLDRLLQKCSDRLSLFVAPNLLDRDYDLPAESYEAVLEMVRKTAPSVVIDLPHVWSSWSRQVLQRADEIVITATPDLASFRNTKNIVETIRAHRANDSEPILVLNQVGVPKRPEVPAEQFAEAAGIEPSVIIHWDPVAFGIASTNAEAVLEAAPKSKSSAAFRDIAARLTGREMIKSKSFSLKSLFSK